jgi:tetratricopeptide (TPR) repeat protein
MAQRIVRKDLKRNELAETVGRTMDYVSHHRRGVTEGIAIGAGLLVLVTGFFLFRAYREREAGKDLSAALAILETPVGAQPESPPETKTYATASERDREAGKHLREAAERKATAAGRAAAVILAARGEKPEEAQESLARVAREGKAEVAALAELNAARLLAAQGKSADAIDRLKRAIENPGSPAPKDALLFALAETYERAGSSTDARATYQRIVNDYPESPYRAEAQSLSGAGR